MKYFLGIDPGKMGSISIIDSDRTVIEVKATPTIKFKKKSEYDVLSMIDIIGYYTKDSFCVIEKSQAMPGQGVVSMFSIGYGYGLWIALLNCFRIPFVEIHPRVWSSKLLKGITQDGKNRNFIAARNLFPHWITTYKYERQYADSLLLAEYGRITYGQSEKAVLPQGEQGQETTSTS